MNISRRKFINASALLLAGTYTASAHKFLPNARNIGFSTLGCPDWPFEKIVSFAREHDLTGLEIRGILKQMDLPLCPEFMDENIGKTKSLMQQNGLQFTDLGSSSAMHIADAAERAKSIADAKRFIDLAEKISCPYIRVFPNSLPKEETKETTITRIGEGIHELAEYAKHKNVTVLMETHGDLVHADDVVNVMKQVNHPNAGLIWDITNMYIMTREPVKEVFEKLSPWIKHTHIKDAKMVDGKIQYVLLGEGEVPIFEAIGYLEKKGYKGFYSFEWEKLWHPELMDPEIAFADFAKKMK